MPVSKQGETKAATDLASASYREQWSGTIAAVRAGAPVHLWNPTSCGTIDMVIDRGGNWFHEGQRIERTALVRLFARILRREADGSYVLVTPQEKLTIRVEDVPFLAVDLALDDSGGDRRIHLLTNLGEVVPLDADHPLRLAAGGPDEPFVPYVTVRSGLEARLTRSLAGSLAELAEERAGRIGVQSGGHFFVIGDASQLGGG